MKKLLTLILFLFVFGAASSTYAQDTPKRKHAIIFKVMEDTFPRSWKPQFNGFLMLLQKDPAAIFVSYPNEDESIEDLKKRLLLTTHSMFFRAKKGPDGKEVEAQPNWEIGEVKLNKGDAKGNYYLSKTEDKWIQVMLYERTKEDTTVVYGYVSMRTAEGKKPKTWAKPDGTGVKIFKKFRKTLTW